MKPNEAHIAHLILAFQDGTITSSEKAQLDALILAYPEYAQDLAGIQLPINTDVAYSGPSLAYPQFEKLTVYATEDGHPYEKLAIAQLEGLLTNEEALLDKSLAQDQLYHDIKQKVKLTKLTPNAKIVYPYQAGLLKEAKVRSLPLKKYLYWTSAAAAVFISVLSVQQNAPDPYSKQQNNHALVGKKESTTIVVEQTSQAKTVPNSINKQVVISHPHIVGSEPRDCIVAVQDPKVNDLQYVYSKSEVCYKNKEYDQDLSTTSENTVLPAPNQTPLPTFRKEPITVKAFLIQKTNERLFGTTAPTADLRYETMARYASQTIGLPVRYEVESGAAADKIIFQLGPISIERSRTKK
ncbi:MAG: hypothetical protein FJ349_06545 [Sphingomonadales bacterium]|nr:hypothetical protein [Sphingomonadales bacterium]